MNAKYIRTVTALVVLAATTAASAEYKCKAPSSRHDERACEEAKKGPDELRRYIERMGWMKVNLRFDDYVDRDTVLAWEADRASKSLAGVPAPVATTPQATR